MRERLLTRVPRHLPCKVDHMVTPPFSDGAVARVLIVDDERVARESLGALLSVCRCTVELAENCEQAFELAKSFQPDFAIIDRRLGEHVDGLELADSLHQMIPAMKIIMVSGEGSLVDNAGRRSPYLFLAKPFQLDELLRVFADHKDGQESS